MTAKLLIVEDDLNLLSGLRDILELGGYHVSTASHGREALAFLKAAQPNELPDLIVSDIMMPHMDGIELLRNVRAQNHWLKIPFIFLTAKGEKTDIQQGRVMGVDDYITKPFDADDLLTAVAAKLDRHRKLNAVQQNEISELKKNILTVLNHEFRTPLTLVVAYADMLKDYETDQLSQFELLTFLKGVNSGADRLRRLIENFILLVEIETGEAINTYNLRKQPINTLEEILIAASQQIINENYMDRPVTIHPVTQPLAVIGDHEYLMVAMRELIDNALKFSPYDTPVEVGAEQSEDWVCFWVQDQGRGVPENERENIWHSFYQINRELYEDQGTGTGLTLVRGIVDIHQGYVTLETEVNQGSRFSLYLPLVDANNAAL